MRMRIVALLLLSCLIASSPLALLPARAQSIPQPDQLSIVLSPQYPRPYESVTATIKSTLIDLAASQLSISLNGKIVSEGERTARFTIGGPGSKNAIVVTAKDADGTHQTQLVIYPADVALIIEPSSTVPPFYKGAKQVASEGQVRLIALTDFQTAAGAKIPPQNLSYTWAFGDRQLEAQSGIGKSALSAKAPVRYRDARVTVTVTTQDRTLVAQASAVVSPVDPFVRIYTNDPLRGIDFANAVGSLFALPGDEETFRAVPFFYKSSPSITWTLNGSDSGVDPDLTVRATGAAKGSALLSARANDADTLNNAETRFTVQFGQARSTGIFGL